LTLARNATLHRAGTGFVLTSVDGDKVRWAQVARGGKVGPVNELTLPAQRAVATPWLGIAGKSTPGDQVVAVYVTPQRAVFAIAQAVGAAAIAPKKLFDLPAAAGFGSLRFAMGSSRTGQRAVLAAGYEGRTVPTMVYVLGADAELARKPSPLYIRESEPEWRCLAVVDSQADFAVTVIDRGKLSAASPDTAPRWHAFEYKDSASEVGEYSVFFNLETFDCPVTTVTPRGYALAYRDAKSVFFAKFDIFRESVNEIIIAGATHFGGVGKLPSLAGLFMTGQHFGVVFDRPAGHEVWRIDAFGHIQGVPLFLPAAAAMQGPLSALSELDTAWASYLDEVPSDKTRPAGVTVMTQRTLVRLDCPTAPARGLRDLPPQNMDAGSDAGNNPG
jgi:hypothetical protein